MRGKEGGGGGGGDRGHAGKGGSRCLSTCPLLPKLGYPEWRQHSLLFFIRYM